MIHSTRFFAHCHLCIHEHTLLYIASAHDDSQYNGRVGATINSAELRSYDIVVSNDNNLVVSSQQLQPPNVCK